MKDDQEFNIWFVKEMEKYPCLYNHQDPNYNIRTEQETAWMTVANIASGTVGECKERWKNLRASFTRHLKHRLLEMKSGTKSKKPYYLASHMNFLLPFTKARSFTGDHLKYYGDIIKMHHPSENVVYLDSEDDTNYCEELKHNAETDTLNQEDEYPISHHHLTLNETENDDDVHLEARRSQEVFHPEEVEDIKVSSQKFKRNAEDEHDRDADAKRHRSSENDADLDFLKSLLPDIKTMNGNQKRKFKINVLKLIDDILNSPTSK